MKRRAILSAPLQALLPLAIAWAEEQSAHAIAAGRVLTDQEVQLARAVGVKNPERIRVSAVEKFLMPGHPALRAAAAQTGLLGPETAGLTLGYAVLVGRGQESPRLLSHEFRHVAQCERAGSIAVFLTEYLKQIVEFGYFDAPFEADAREAEDNLARLQKGPNVKSAH